MSTYVYDNQEFSSIKALAQYMGINQQTLTARLRRGMPIETACQKTDFRCSYYLDNNIPKSITQVCREQEKNSKLVRNRLKYGYTLNEALNRPKKITRQGKPVVVNGILYNSIASALQKLDLVQKETTVRRRLKAGMKPDDAFRFE